MLIIRPVRGLWAIVGGVTLLALVVYIASRTVGLPGSTDDIGNWTQTLGILTVATELFVLAVVAAVAVGVRYRHSE
jgi:NADH:ubiquinone oxidoreductase subunit 4 (subunit M)